MRLRKLRHYDVPLPFRVLLLDVGKGGRRRRPFLLLHKEGGGLYVGLCVQRPRVTMVYFSFCGPLWAVHMH